MIDRLREFAKQVIWLKPLLFIAVAASCIVFGYVVLFEENAEKDIYIIPSIVGMLWSLVCLFLLSVFPYVPPRPDKKLRFSKRLKIRLTRVGYHLGSLIFCVLSASVVLLTLKLLNVWHSDF
jgi:fatty acid desaturase